VEQARGAQDLGLSASLLAEPARAATPPPPISVTPALIEAARKEGKFAYYCALEAKLSPKANLGQEPSPRPASYFVRGAVAELVKCGNIIRAIKVS
jgi:hypothetical protein